MEKMDIQKQAIMLIEQLSTEELKEVVDYLADLQLIKTQPTWITDISCRKRRPEKGQWNVLSTRIFSTDRWGRT